jgi:hypothetical protein
MHQLPGTGGVLRQSNYLMTCFNEIMQACYVEERERTERLKKKVMP